MQKKILFLIVNRTASASIMLYLSVLVVKRDAPNRHHVTKILGAYWLNLLQLQQTESRILPQQTRLLNIAIKQSKSE